MKGMTLIKKLNKSQRCIISDEDYDECLGKFYFVLTPLFDNDNQPFFYYKKVDNGYLVEGESYICKDEESAKLLRSRTNKQNKSVNYIENNELK